MIAVIILNWNGKEDTLECLDSIYRMKGEFFVFVADNGSKDGSLKAINERFPQAALIDNKENLGYAEGNNRAILAALNKKADYCLILNNDTIVDPSLLLAFLDAAHKKPEGGIFGAKVLRYQEREVIDNFGGMWDPKRGEFTSIGLGEKDGASFSSLKEVDYVSGCSLFIKKEVFEKIGLFDPRFFLIWEESDLCTRAKKAGYKIFAVPDARIYHKISKSFSGKAHTFYFFWRNRLLFLEKHLSKKELSSLYRKVLFLEILRLYRHYFCLNLQLLFSKDPKKAEKKKRLYAGIQGVQHYFLRRFFSPPAAFFQKLKVKQ